MNEKKIIQQSDHIILPKATLKRFMGSYDKIYYIDFCNINKIYIDSKYPNAYQVIRNYYNPIYDAEVKKVETEMGQLYKKVIDCHSKQSALKIDLFDLKDKIISFTTMQFNRAVIANDSLINKYMQQQQKENNLIDSMLLRMGAISKERCKYSIEFREKASSLHSFKYYSQNILGTDNNVIQKNYKNFVPLVLFIPENIKNSFLLPPMHFVGNETFLHFILSPNVSLALFPMCSNFQYKNYVQIINVSEERVKNINLRILESVVGVDANYRKIVGLEQHLKPILKKINNIKDSTYFNNKTLCCKSSFEVLLKDLDDVFELAIILYILYIKRNENKLLILNLRKEYFSADCLDNDINEISNIFKRYMFDLRIT